jgi:tripartite-type tricarboxylate transporter receptor subunit TctC
MSAATQLSKSSHPNSRCYLAKRSVRRATLLALGSAMAVLPSLTSTAWADATNFYAGKSIDYIVGSDVGGSYNVFARMIARHIPKYIPGQPNIVVQNLPGAGGLRAANSLYNVAPRDGLTIGMINNTLAFDPLYGNKNAQFDATKFNWLGTPSRETGLLIVWHTVPVDTLEDAKKRELILSATGTGSTPAFFARVLASIFDIKVKIIPGYKSQTESFLAMERLENDGNASPFWSSLNSENPTWIPEKKIKVLTYYGATRVPEIPGPYALDLITDPEKRATMTIAQAGLSMGRPSLAPPDVPADKLAVLRQAFESTFKDPEYLAECAKQRLNCATPSTGAEMLEMIKEVYSSPKGAIDKITEIYMLGQQKS